MSPRWWDSPSKPISERRHAQKNAEHALGGHDEDIDVGSDATRRQTREDLEEVDVRDDAVLRQTREDLEEEDVRDDAKRRQTREDLEDDDVRDDVARRQTRDFRRVSDLKDLSSLGRSERLQAQKHQAQRLENLGQLAGGVAHDFNNLLGIILNYASFVSKGLTNASESDWVASRDSALKDLGQITKAAEAAATLTRQLLTFARQEVVRPQVLNLNVVVASIEEMLRRTIGEHVELVTSLDDELWLILADRGQMEQVLVNLAVNARDAMPEGGVLSIDTSNIRVDDEMIAGGAKAIKGRNVRLRVSDNGFGMSPEIAEHVFEPFFTTKDVDRGTGLGLSTVYGILSQSEGQISIYSEIGIGTTFSITLPVTTESAEPVPYERMPKGETILVVEDQLALREVTARILTGNGFRVLTATDGPDAIALTSNYSGEIHLLVTDVIMPGMLGKEVAERIKAIKPTIQVLFMSGYARPILASQGRLDPSVALLEKPFSEAELIQMTGEVLNGNFRGFDTVVAP
jgi:signal transduction histidine kinase